MILHPEAILPRPATSNLVTETIYARRAVRKYKNTPVDPGLVKQLIEAGRMAPSAINLQPYRFIVIDNAKLIADLSGAILSVAKPLFRLSMRLWQAAGHSDPIFYSAPVVIFLIGKKNNEWVSLDAGMCAQNIMLAAKSLGLDTCPIGFARLIEKTEEKVRMQLHNDEEVLLAITIGYGDESPLFHGRKTDNLTYIKA